MQTLTSTTLTSFAGFSPGLLEFLANLRANNRREWFQAHRGEYETLLLQPARDFVTSLGELLHYELGEDIHAEPRVFGSILQINRDTRFSKDKTPYKTHLDLWFWQGDARGANRERPDYFFRLTPESLMLGAGMHAFSGDGQLERYRVAVLDAVRGQQLEQLPACTQQELQGRTYARVPRGLPVDHPRAEWLRHSGLFAQVEQTVPPELFTAELPEFCMRTFRRLQPLQLWLVEALGE